MVIGDRPLDELVPLYRDPKSNFPITQFNWKMVEAAGLVKFDFLGLKTLTVLQKAVELIKRGRGIDVDLTRRCRSTTGKSYELLARADTVGVFQLESTGMRDSLKRLKPDRFEDIIAMVALYRPGPMDNIPTYINRKHGEEPVDYLHPMLKPILKETYGVIIYQEQVMQIAQVMAGYSLGQADLLRRAMGKKDKDEMAKQQARFVEGATKNGVKKERRRLHLRAGRQVRRLRLQQEPRRRLCAGQLSHGLSEGELPRGVPGRLHDARHGQHRQARDVRGRGAPQRHRDQAAVRQCLGGGFPAGSRRPMSDQRSDAGPCAQRGAIRYSLAALKNIGAARGRDDRRRAASERAVQVARRFCRAASIRRRSTSAGWKRWRRRAPSTCSRPTARWCTPTSKASWRWPTGSRPTRRPAPAICSPAPAPAVARHST